MKAIFIHVCHPQNTSNIMDKIKEYLYMKSMDFYPQNPSEVVHRRKDFGGQNPWILTPRTLGTDLGINKNKLLNY